MEKNVRRVKEAARDKVFELLVCCNMEALTL